CAGVKVWPFTLVSTSADVMVSLPAPRYGATVRVKVLVPSGIRSVRSVGSGTSARSTGNTVQPVPLTGQNQSCGRATPLVAEDRKVRSVDVEVDVIGSSA